MRDAVSSGKIIFAKLVQLSLSEAYLAAWRGGPAALLQKIIFSFSHTAATILINIQFQPDPFYRIIQGVFSCPEQLNR